MKEEREIELRIVWNTSHQKVQWNTPDGDTFDRDEVTKQQVECNEWVQLGRLVGHRVGQLLGEKKQH